MIPSSTAALSPPVWLQTNSQFLRLCGAPYKRKNWLFLGSELAGSRSAVLHTILAGAKRHRLEPWAYIRDVLLRLHAESDDLTSLLPDHWATAHPEHVLTHRLEESRRKAR